MTQLTKIQKIGIAAHLITTFVWKSARQKDRISVPAEQFSHKNIGPDHLQEIAQMFDQRAIWSRALHKHNPDEFTRETTAVLETIQHHAPSFRSLSKLRALEGIKVFDLHFGSDHAEAMLLESVEEAIFEEIQAQAWFSDQQLSA